MAVLKSFSFGFYENDRERNEMDDLAQNIKLGLPYTHKNKITDEMFIC
ncbi:hypothetical protein [Metabacillus litoralis]|nr:hypothetical protein [Metabacillus litoralis]MCM3161137.1 hypothetical protein [Metabacillus litoralis]MCM3412011.1 hypothetical protein [Metabacillus litoralis]